MLIGCDVGGRACGGKIVVFEGSMGVSWLQELLVAMLVFQFLTALYEFQKMLASWADSLEFSKDPLSLVSKPISCWFSIRHITSGSQLVKVPPLYCSVCQLDEVGE